LTAEEIVRTLDLKPHPEGGYYRETYRSSQGIPGFTPSKTFSTAIYYLLTPGDVSKFHRLKSDEIFHFYLGDASEWVWLTPDGKMKKFLVGPRLDKGELLQMVIPAGTWFGGRLAPGSGFCLMGTTVAPAFDFPDLQFATREGLLKQYPQASHEIESLI
jgi:hypothetical protein